jgi:hypothetical protein
MLFGVLAVKETVVSAAVKNNKFKIWTNFPTMLHIALTLAPLN